MEFNSEESRSFCRAATINPSHTGNVYGALHLTLTLPVRATFFLREDWTLKSIIFIDRMYCFVNRLKPVDEFQ